MSIKDFETGDILRDVDIDRKLYHNIKYGDIVVYRDGEYEI